MKNKFKIKSILAAICVIGFSHVLQAQSIYKTGDSKANDMKLSGTSTFHDWTMNTTSFTGEAQFDFKPGDANQLTALKSLSFTLVVMNLKSGEKAMDENAYKALKSDQYKYIVYKLIYATVQPVKDNKYTVKTVGNLVIAGVSKKITMDVSCVINKDGTLTSSGTYKLNMTDYQVKPPTFMLGAMKTGDAITLAYTMVYKK